MNVVGWSPFPFIFQTVSFSETALAGRDLGFLLS